MCVCVCQWVNEYVSVCVCVWHYYKDETYICSRRRIVRARGVRRQVETRDDDSNHGHLMSLSSATIVLSLLSGNVHNQHLFKWTKFWTVTEPSETHYWRKVEGMWRKGRRRQLLLDDHNEIRWFWKLKEEAIADILWRTRFGRLSRPVTRQTMSWRQGRICYWKI